MTITTILFLIGRILYGGYFLINGINHFIKMEMMKGYAASKGVPIAGLAVAVSGLLIIFGGLGILFGFYTKWAITAIVIFLICVSCKMHNFWKATDSNIKMADMIHFMKNIALIGAALMMLAIPIPWLFSLAF
ncbi:DoxX family protein [Candidatus Wolfebacteria bacterium]|nr:DoxX family protein [Candidatus Wolfebacteria bacterium]